MFNSVPLRTQGLSLTLLFSATLLVVSAFNYGFSDQAFASCQAMEPFIRQFGIFDKTTGVWKVQPLFTSLYNSLKAGAQIVGVFAGSYVSDRFGRRMCVFTMSVYSLGSAAVVISAQTRVQILTGRALHYVYLGMQLAVIPTTLAELAPARVRGAMGVLFWLSIKVGGLVVTCITRGTSAIPNDAAWRIPFGLFLVVPSIIIGLVWFTPEPPRWLLLRDRQIEAIASLKRLKNKNVSRDEIQSEFDELCQRVAMQLQRNKFGDIFVPENRRRTFVVVMVNFFQQATGQAFASQYGTLFVKSLKSVNPFSITIGTNAVDIGALIMSAFTVDRLGRRILFLLSAVLQSGALLTMGGLGTVHDQSALIRQGIVAMLLVYSFAWSIGWAPLTYVIGAELPSAPLREVTLQMAYTVKLVTEFAVTFSYPYLETDAPGHVDLGGRLGFIYGSSAVLAAVFAYFFIPETSRLILEDIDRNFYPQMENKGADMIAYSPHPKVTTSQGHNAGLIEDTIYNQ